MEEAFKFYCNYLAAFQKQCCGLLHYRSLNPLQDANRFTCGVEGHLFTPLVEMVDFDFLLLLDFLGGSWRWSCRNGNRRIGWPG